MSEYSFVVFTIMATSSLVAIKLNAWWVWLIGYYFAAQVKTVKVMPFTKKKDEEKKE